MRRLFLLLFTCPLLASPCVAATYTATSCSTADVQTQVTAATDGDTVIIPNGSCTWSSAGITTGKQIKIQGQTQGGVTLTLDGNFSMFTLTTGASVSTEVSNLVFHTTAANGAALALANYLSIQGAASDKTFLIHHNSFFLPDFGIINAVDILRMGGLVHHNIFESDNAAQCNGLLGGYSCGAGGGVMPVKPISQAATSWATPDTMGSNDTTGFNNLYIEDNTFVNTVNQSVDCDDGARVVIRHNTFNDSALVCHGGDTSSYGNRHTELYDNTFVFHTSGSCTVTATCGGVVYPLNLGYWWNVRGGTGLITNNVMPNISSSMWGAKSTDKLQILNIHYNGGPHPCCTEGYPCIHQVGRGENNTADPFYIWGNSGTGTPESPSIETYTPADAPQYNACSGGVATDYIQNPRDYVTGTALSGWTRYTYPHPLQGGGSAPSAPTGLHVVRAEE